MKIITRTLLGISLPALLLATGSSYAAASLQSVDSAVQASGKSTLRLQFDSKVGIPKSFIMKQNMLNHAIALCPSANTMAVTTSSTMHSRAVRKDGMSHLTANGKRWKKPLG